MNWESLKNLFDKKNLCILGFGREGKAMVDFLIKHYSGDIVVADANPEIQNSYSLTYASQLIFQTGEHYLDDLNRYDLIIKSPGIPKSQLIGKVDFQKVTSQTDLFLELFRHQVTGITGTKGKSTTSSLIYHILSSARKDTVLLGNIGIPAISLIDRIRPETSIIFELSSHQLEDVKHSPHIGLLLNIFEEHLDHYASFEQYQQAKFNITRFQNQDDIFVYPANNIHIQNLLRDEGTKAICMSYSLKYQGNIDGWWENNCIYINFEKEIRRIVLENQLELQGEHNRLNILAACMACLQNGISEKVIERALPLFKPLPHRMEYLGAINGKYFYNDSIATIPQATIAAIQTLPKVDTLIVGGYNRGINYQHFIEFLAQSSIQYLMLTGEVGKIIQEGLQTKSYKGEVRFYEDFKQLVEDAISLTPQGGTCLLSPAAASYDRFKNFEERGNLFKKIVISSNKCN
ncbi:MAG TPA: UDP-N-acetylmuramoyl-L-alanine--D-glutamate ligase [Bacteroidales bacterium]|mgnify:FL=1|nr:UDP-N-acetylmuramoyl-L-alanine--D-glutamate ligase [Bacteroidales bacterium]